MIAEYMKGEGMSELSGVLGQLTSAQFRRIFSDLPTGEPLLEKVPGGFLTTEFVQKLQKDQFSGYGLVAFSNGDNGFFAFFRGRILEAWRQLGTENLLAARAYRSIISDLSSGIVSLYKLLPESVPAVVSLTFGSPRMNGVSASGIVIPELVNSMAIDKFSGAVVHEKEDSLNVWYFLRGSLLFGKKFPNEFSVGKLYMVQTPSTPPEDLLEAAELEEKKSVEEELSAVWGAAAVVLKEYMGRGGDAAMERLKRSQSADTADELYQQLRKWMAQSLEPSAAVQFDKISKRVQ